MLSQSLAAGFILSRSAVPPNFALDRFFSYLLNTEHGSFGQPEWAGGVAVLMAGLDGYKKKVREALWMELGRTN